MSWHIQTGDCRMLLAGVERDSVQAVVTSPPYWQLRDYGDHDQFGHETLIDYVLTLGDTFDLVRDTLHPKGVLWLNLGDTFAGGGGYCPTSPSNCTGSKQSTNRGSFAHSRPIPEGRKKKDLLGVPWMVAFELQKRGWYLRCDVIWEKSNAFPEKVKDRPQRSHEYIFLFSKSPKYKFNNDVIQEQHQGNKKKARSVWHIAKSHFRGVHTAVFPEELVERCLLSSTDPDDLVMDPFTGSGTTGVVACRLKRRFIGFETNSDYAESARQRIGITPLSMNGGEQ